MDGIVEKVFMEQLPWLAARTRRLAGQLARSGTTRQSMGDGGRLDLADELLSRVALCFYKAAGDGWFKQVPRVSLAAQVRSRLVFCMTAAATDFHRDGKKARRSVTAVTNPEDGEAIDIHETLEREDEARADEALAEHQRNAAARVAVRRALDALANPSYRLVLKLVYFPLEVTENDLARSAGFKAGGHVFVLRSVPEAWSLLLVERTIDSATDDDAAWKRTTAWIIRLRCPRAEALPAQLDTAVAAIDQKLTSAKRAMAANLREEP